MLADKLIRLFASTITLLEVEVGVGVETGRESKRRYDEYRSSFLRTFRNPLACIRLEGLFVRNRAVQSTPAVRPSPVGVRARGYRSVAE